ncbi:hypothetical protein [Haloarcula nitratireducens]|uniref:Uncharacterized protein n=1 Tax=Haloarcula nitratireducens TaxID=2487749 RepID=A0AAW4PIC9_9EURY|nr:hypothetical protein [Halomicroarcula nitratireducens]MBX0297872.1 hypothetical protein [Halomicroarcula nitratireducens]
MTNGLEYQITLLADTLQKAVLQGALGPKEAGLLKERLQAVESMADAHELWTTIEEEFDVLESSLWD